MLKPSTRRRKLVRFLAVLLLVGIAGLVALPGWLPWVLPTVAKHAGVTFASYSRHGYQRFELRDVVFTNNAGTFEAQRIEACVPTVLFWRGLFDPGTESLLTVDSWKWKSAPRSQTTNHPSASTPGVFDLFQGAKHAAARLHRWLPNAGLTQGSVQFDDQVVTIPQVQWSGGILSADAIGPQPEFSFALHASLDTRHPFELNLESDELDLRCQATTTESADGLQVAATTLWISNRIQLQASFPRQGLLPEDARLDTEPFTLPARWFQLEDHADFTGAFHARWKTNRLAVELNASAQPQASQLPPIDLEVRCSGDVASAQVDVARFSAPWLKAELSGPARLRFAPPFLPESVALNVTADLNQQPWFAAQGLLAGRADLHPSFRSFPQINFALAGSDVVVSNIATKTLRLDGVLLWPRVELLRADAEMADGSTFSLSGNWHLRQHLIEAGRLQYSGAFGQQFLPPGFAFRSATLNAEFSGPLQALTNSARLAIQDLSLPATRPMKVEAQWSGRGWQKGQLNLAVAAGDSRLRLEGKAEMGMASNHLEATTLELGRSNRVEFQLLQPFQVNWPSRTAATHQPTLTVEPIRCAGEDRSLELEAWVRWPQLGVIHAAAKGLDGALIHDFLEARMPLANLDRLNCDAAWTNEPVRFQLEASARMQPVGATTFAAELKLAGDSNGVTIGRFEVASTTQIVCRAEGKLPAMLVPGATNGLVQIQSEAPLRLSVITEPDTVLWDEVTAFSKVRFQGPDLEATLDRTWARPSGRIRFQAQHIEFSQTNRPLPALDDVHLALDLNQTTARLSRFEALVEGQRVELSAAVPLATDFWENPTGPPRWLDWRKATAHLKIADAKLAPFAGFLPETLIPEGKATADLEFKPGPELWGKASVSGAGTRPLGSIGAVRDIAANAVFAGRSLLLTNVSASLGGHLLNLWGKVDCDEDFLQGRRLPPFVLHLQGTELPLVRQPNIILRADADLLITNDPAATPLISGTVNLREGLFLADLKSLVPQSTASPAQRPPYFSIATEPYADWRLAINVSGEKFMRVQTPLFCGHLSTTLKLTHTLKDPIALGEVRIPSGNVIFPFGGLDIEHGFASLTSDNPFQPQLDLQARALNYGYDVKLEVTGPADSPVVQFSSTPPLSSEQIILMLTTGQLPLGVGMSTSTTQRAGGLALFVGKNFLTDLGFGGTGSDRLTLRSGEQVSEKGHSTYEVEYELLDDLSVIGSYDRFDQYNLNLKWRIYSK